MTDLLAREGQDQILVQDQITSGSGRNSNSGSGSSGRGLASMSKADRTRIARMGGQASHGGGRSSNSGRSGLEVDVIFIILFL
ncbi:KGG domain-containing protein [Chryseobacterium nematophagum]|uniref:KGG domain-containing protein n=1 Tax=Chryseobacterium nematophagum TaxID=2305228 RepID=UPI001E488E65|nr:KGG domain-containing protein [Chryseobacterium nematophagum]